MSNYQKYTPKQRKEWGAKMAAARAAKRKPVYTGRGAYVKSTKKAALSKRRPRKTEGQIFAKELAPALAPLITAGLSAAGTAVGGPLLGAVGGLIGTAGDAAMKYFTGKGDYKVVSNCFLNGDDNSMTPIYNKHRSGGDVFRRQEYLCDIISSPSANTFKIQSFSVNPGLESTFQWLSQIACNYEEYEFEGLYFEFRSMSGDALNSVNTALGQVVMAANYNAASPNFTNKQQMENYEGGVSGRPSSSIRYFVECAKLRTILSELYVRQGAVPQGLDQRLYDLCNFQIATNGMQGTNVNLGELWVSYQVVLRKPKLWAALGQYNGFASVTPVTGAYTNSKPLGSSGTWNIGASNTLNGLAFTSTDCLWNAPTLPQSYMLYIVWTGTQVNPVVAPTIAGSTNSGLVAVSTNFTSKSGTDTATVASLQCFLLYDPTTWTGMTNTSNVPSTGFSLGTGGSLPSSGTAVSIYIVQIPNTMYGI